MSYFLGLDTSNYTTSAALYDSGSGRMISKKKLLPVKKGEAGLRQSDAVFHHTKQLPEIMKQLFSDVNGCDISAIGVSCRPRNAEGSYMPCFLCGEGLAESIGAVKGVPVYRTSHQVGHILAALYSAGKLSLINEPFIAFHVSGGTTDCLYCVPHKDELIRAEETGTSLDLKAGQLIDRTGLMLGLSFPCGPELERLAENSCEKYPVKTVIRDGSCCLSGFQNKAEDMVKKGTAHEDIAMYIQNCIAKTVFEMTRYAREIKGDIPVIYAGGVMSNKYIKSSLEKRMDNIFFAEPVFSADNAAGTALYGCYMNEGHF